jgi:hypothetical protein
MAIALQGSFDDLGTPLSQVTFVVVDVETTGGSPSTDSLTEVAAARYRGGEMLGTYQTFVRPDERIPPFITALTGISDAMVADAPRVGEMLPSFLEFVGRSVLVGHNLRFDLSFLDHALMATGRARLANRTVDTLALARRLVRDVVPDCKLGTGLSPTCWPPATYSTPCWSEPARSASSSWRNCWSCPDWWATPRRPSCALLSGSPIGPACTGSPMRPVTSSTWARPRTCTPESARTSPPTNDGKWADYSASSTRSTTRCVRDRCAPP